MKTSLLTLLVASAISLARAQAPSGTNSFDINADTGPLLWNFKGVDLFDPPLATVDFQNSWGTLWSNHWAVGQVWGDGNTTRVRAGLNDWWWDQTFYPYGGIAEFRLSLLNLTLDT